MTNPRQFLPRSTYFITRRTTQREFWLKPTRQTTQIFLYCIAIAAQKTGVSVHAACVMSNHWHAVVSDSDTKIAEFYGWVHRFVAKAINCARDREENLWSSNKASVVRLESDADILNKVAYTMCNPVRAFLTARADNWSGVWLYRQTHSQTVKRPEVYFVDEGTMPETAELRISPPTLNGEVSASRYEQTIADEISRIEREIATEMRATRRRFMGMNAVLAQAHSDRPRTDGRRGEMNPGLAAKDKVQRIAAIERYRQFVTEYRNALKEWKTGNREILFPPGTYAMRIHAGVNVHPG